MLSLLNYNNQMKKVIILLIFLNISLLANQSILIINSYHKGYEFSDKIISAMEKEFYKNSNLDINILYMDSKRIITKEYFDNLKNLYKVQLNNRKYDLVVAVDRFAYDFVLENYLTFFNDIPVLSVGIENFSEEKAKKYALKKISVLLEKRDLSSNIKLIEKSLPTLKKVYIINDKSINALHTEPLINQILKEHKGSYEIEYYQGNSLNELKDKFSKYKKDEAILFIRFYKNSDGELNKNQEIAQFIKSSKLPVFITDSIFIKKGAFGGKIVDLDKFGFEASQMVFDILNKNIYKIKVFDKLEYVFDEQKIKEFLIFPSSLVKDYTLVNRSLTFYDTYRGFINIVFTISPLLLILIVLLIKNILMRKKVQSQLLERIEFDYLLLNAIDSPIFWENKKGIIVDSNLKFAQWLNLDMKNINGKKIEDFKENKNVAKILKVIKKFRNNEVQNYEFKYNDNILGKRVFILKQAKYKDSKSNNEGVVTIFTDITKEKKIEEEQQKNRQFTIQQSKLAEIGEVFSSIAHQWKSPLVEITTIAQEQFYMKNNTEQKEDESFVSDIMKQVNYMTNTINDFQKFIMPSNHKTEFDVYKAIRSILEIINHNMKYNNINIDIKVKKESCLLINGYKNEFMQSFLNIINNAKDVLLKNDYKNRKIEITLFNKKDRLIIVIQDNAGGINKKNIEKVFKAYYSTKKDGHGIGLYMSKMIIEDKMDGKLCVKNRKDGACFLISLGCRCENISFRR